MKKAFKIILVVFSLFLTFLLVNAYERNDSIKYFRYLETSSSSFNIDNNQDLTQDKIDSLNESFTTSGINVTKTVYYEDYRSIYIGGDVESYIDFLDSVGINFNDIRSINSIDTPFVATYDTKEENQIYNSKDFMGNDKVRFYMLRDIEKSGGYGFGIYDINLNDVSIDEGNIILNNVLEDVYIQEATENHIVMASNLYLQYSLIVILILLVFMVVTSIFSMYHESKKISIMSLHGYKLKDILIEFTKTNFITILITYILATLLLLVFVRNLSFLYFLLHTVVFILITLMYMIISLLSLNIILKTKSITTSLNRQNITDRILYVNTVLKLVIGVFLILLSFNLTEKSSELLSVVKANREFIKIGNIAVHGGIWSKIGEEYDTSVVFYDLNSFFQSLENEGFDLIVSSFHDFTSLESNEESLEDPWFKDLFEDYIKKIENHEIYLMGRVDRNYLIKEDIEVFDKDGLSLDLSKKLDKRVYLIPKSKENEIDKIKSYVPSSDYGVYRIEKGLPVEFEYFLYDDQAFKTFTPYQIEDDKVESPVIELVDYGTSTSFDELGGISIAGGGEETNVKFFLSKDQDKLTVYEKQVRYMKANDVEKYLPLINFKTYGEMFGQGAYIAIASLLTLAVMVISLLSIYILITLQQVKLYMERTKKIVSIKKLLGYKSYDIYNEILFITAGTLFVSVFFSLIYSRMRKDTIFYSVIALIIVIEAVVIFISSTQIIKSNSIKGMKGE